MTAYLIADQDTIAVCPADAAGEMVPRSAIGGRRKESRLPLPTDARALVIFEPTPIDAEFLLPKFSAIPLLNQFLDWLGPASRPLLSLDWQLDEVQSELIVRNQGGLQARTVERQMQKRLDQLAENVLNAIKEIGPR
ncbi:MAG: hypothetical protein U0872_09765 [Planctomycetaceae bacterium]